MRKKRSRKEVVVTVLLVQRVEREGKKTQQEPSTELRSRCNDMGVSVDIKKEASTICNQVMKVAYLPLVGFVCMAVPRRATVAPRRATVAAPLNATAFDIVAHSCVFVKR